MSGALELSGAGRTAGTERDPDLDTARTPGLLFGEPVGEPAGATALTAGREPVFPVAARRVPVVTADVAPVLPVRGRDGGFVVCGSAAAPVASSSPEFEGGSAERKDASMM